VGKDKKLDNMGNFTMTLVQMERENMKNGEERSDGMGKII
jgi:hypothetical protein